MNFTSDNATGAHPAILNAIGVANGGSVGAYGGDALSRSASDKIAATFERNGDEAAVFLLGTGTAANALALAALTPPYGAVYCHRDAHINTDECGAPEMFTGGAKLIALDGAHGKIAPATLQSVLSQAGHGVHRVTPRVLSLTQSSEAGTVYTPDEIGTLADIAHQHGLAVHMDGARFANAVAALNCSPAELSWKAGVDVLCFGASKNGALAAEALIVFAKADPDDIAFRRKRAGHLFSKMRFIAAQFDAYLEDGLWLANARHANAAARRLADALDEMDGVRLAHPVQANEIFIHLPASMVTRLEADGAAFYRWAQIPGEETVLIRLVTAFNTPDDDIDALIAIARAEAAKS
ncbi:threonine aldolase family protein [Varunaivibrio sulfuroxidans]|uniref:L-threonine aldolase n=1 Tax=Varunaivibrio sulfuroxidans TaxID=1773489 RepID=A0A4R3JCW4_9PROT|nr:beta-eliminating lyase-related protein [Varunaivibrio sulfuroxidans]TCS62520.1 L-threonine aldolase [Varunaivibrio sulfuroxidans]WES30809.1 beta-eliminating lyase-related protein [Varunaivibrio sulfuroxidans]